MFQFVRSISITNNPKQICVAGDAINLCVTGQKLYSVLIQLQIFLIFSPTKLQINNFFLKYLI